MNAFQLFFAELKSIVSRPKILIPLLGVMMIPLLYTGMFLYAFWNPYDKTDKLPVAVVNQDTGAQLSGEKINAGQDLVNNLEKNDDFDWQFVSKEKAEDDFREDKNFMIVEIPKNFSEHAASVTKDKTQKMMLSYQVNRNYNYIVSKIGEAGIKAIHQKISSEITQSYAQSMFDRLNALKDGLKKAGQGANDLANGGKKEADGLKKLNTGLSRFTDASQSLQTGSDQLVQGSEGLYHGLNQMSVGAGKLYNQTETKSADVARLAEGTVLLSSKLDELNHGVTELSDGGGQIVDGSKTLEAKMNDFKAGLQQELEGINQLKVSLSQSQQEVAKLGQSMNEFEDHFSELVAGIQGIDTGIRNVNSNLQKGIDGYVANHPEAMNDSNFQLIAGTAQESENTLQKSADQLNGQAQLFQKSVSAQFSGVSGFSQKFAQLSSAVAQLADGQKSLTDNFGKLQDGQSELAAGLEQFQKNVDKLPASAQALKAGADQIAAGNEQLSQSWPVLVSSIGDLNNGQDQLLSGSQKLMAGMTKMNDGLLQLSGGAEQLGNGTSALVDGAGKLYEGNQKLGSQLGKARNQLGATPTDNAHAKMFSEPVTLNDATQSNVNTYGSGFTPYFLSLGLYIGALILTVIYDVLKPSGKPRSGIGLGISKTLMMMLIGVGQALGVSLILLFGLDLKVDSIPIFILFTMMTSLTFMLIVQFFSTFGNVGRFFVILVLILQLTSSGGTYSVQLIPQSLQALPKFLPMTYSIAGLRNIIAGEQYDLLRINMLMLVLFMAILFFSALTVYTVKFKKDQAKQMDAQAAEIN